MKKTLQTLIILLIGYYSNSQTVGLITHTTQSLDNGYVLFAPIGSNTTYLIDKCGKQVKNWNSNYRPGQSVYLLSNSILLRSGNINNTTFNAGGKGGIIEKIDWNGNVIWNYTVSDATKCQHHDIKALPNGNVLVIAWESKTNTEAIAQGRNPSLVPTTLWSEQILEIEPVGTNGGNVVWEWHLWDHLIQDYDATKPNYGTIVSNAQLLNINYNASATVNDWIHLNSIDYNDSLKQILVSSHATNEIWIIDHSTTTAQAASHTGGNAGKGGDFIYRWGNPLAYNAGTIADKKLFGQHNAHWIDSSLPYKNQIMIFNNGNGRTGGNYSTVEIINPPVNGYNYTNTIPYLPNTTSWIYNAGNPNSFYAQNISGAQQLSNGNVIICNGPSGTFTEITSTGTTVWKYINPVSGAGIITQNATPTQNLAFRCSFYPTDFAGFTGHTLTTGNIIENNNTVSATCNLMLSLGNTTNPINNANSNNSHQINIYPNPANRYIYIASKDATLFNVSITLMNNYGQIIYTKKNVNIANTISVPIDKITDGVYFLKLESKNINSVNKIVVAK